MIQLLVLSILVVVLVGAGVILYLDQNTRQTVLEKEVDNIRNLLDE